MERQSASDMYVVIAVACIYGAVDAADAVVIGTLVYRSIALQSAKTVPSRCRRRKLFRVWRGATRERSAALIPIAGTQELLNFSG